CGMNLVEVSASSASAPQGAAAPSGSSIGGLAPVQIDPARQQLIGLKTAEATHGPIGGAWRTVGRVAIDETRVRHVNLKVPGFIEQVYVDFVGKRVQKGDPLFSIYSPELFSAQGEYLLALRTQRALNQAGGDANQDGDSLVRAARRKLSLWDVPDSAIERIARTGEPERTLTFYSPLAGVVTKKDVVQGMKLDAGAMPYEIVDLSRVWVLADIYEVELQFVREGMAATLRLNAFPNREFKGQVVFIDPLLDPQTRTVKVRLTFDNRTGELRPEMFGEVVLHGVPHEGLWIPLDAVIDTGTDKVVFVAGEGGRFEPRKVRLGASDETRAEVVSGLVLGERVVTRANFLVDSESRLRASLAELSTAASAPASPDSARVLPKAAEPAPLPLGPGLPAPTSPSAATPGAHAGHTR
ncbi:MAG TPA: efflux RND transporter periplasmic adaptor subunit, partial [Polyangiaceae bacterium]|nr:efflux RND transporter periplasmic adaptor subunit [Polyangiaceae bacterium]